MSAPQLSRTMFDEDCDTRARIRFIARANKLELECIEYQLDRSEALMKKEPLTPRSWYELLDLYRLKVAERKEKAWL